jgi:GntR family transcriptional regulator / MocR family aminotransferase
MSGKNQFRLFHWTNLREAIMARHAEHQALALPIRPPRVPIHRWLYAEMRAAILNGRLASGQRLPPTRDLADQFGIARGTAVAVFEQLAAEGYVTAAAGRGTHVASSLPDSLFTAVTPRTQLPKTGVRAIRLSDRARPLTRSPFPRTGPTTPCGAFRAGQPDLMAFPVGLWSRIGNRIGRRSQRLLLAGGDVAGYRPLREAIAAYLGTSRGIRCSAEQIVLVASVQQGLDLCVRLLVNPDERVWMEDPGYPAARSVLEAADAKTISVPVDAEGLDVAAGQRSAPSAKFIYVTPGRQYPLGVALSLRRRLELLRWAEQSGAVIFEDDYDSEFRFSGPPLAALKSLDSIDRVVYAGTFSKLLFPAIRLAYLVLPGKMIDPFVAALSLTTRHMPTWNQVILSDFIAEGHFSRHLRRMRTLYSERSEALQKAAQAYWSDFLVMPKIESGLDTAVLLRAPIDDHAAVAAAAKANIELRPLSGHSQRRPRLRGFVVGFAAVDPRSIFDGACRLARILEEQVFRQAQAHRPVSGH